MLEGDAARGIRLSGKVPTSLCKGSIWNCLSSETQGTIHIHDNFKVSVFGIAFGTGIYT